MRKIAITFFSLWLFVQLVSAQEPLSRKEKKQAKKQAEFIQLDSLIEGNAYVFIAKKANPSGGGQVDLSTHNATLTILNDSVISYLPFFGRAYNVAYGSSDSGIKFETILKEYVVKKDTSKMQILITFKASNASDAFDCILQTGGSGSTTLSVSSNNRAFISYFGNIQAIKD